MSAQSSHHAGLHFDVARSLQQVEEAWELVYRSYLRAGYIKPNLARCHTVLQAIGEHVAVICGRIEPLAVSTVTAYLDNPAGLPLDAVFPEPMNALRAQNRRLVELGLLADRREHLYRSIEAMLELARFGCYFGVHAQATDGVIGVPPGYVNFYTRLLGFEVCAAAQPSPHLQSQTVVMLRLDWQDAIRRQPLPRALAYFVHNPIPPEVFTDRFRPTIQNIQGSSIHRYLMGQADHLRVA